MKSTIHLHRSQAVLALLFAGAATVPFFSLSNEPVNWQRFANAYGISAGERSALIALYNSTNGAGWNNRTNWRNVSDSDFNDPGTECSWFGVTCTGSTVTGIKLNSNNLQGEIPPEIDDLSNLVTLKMQTNDLGDTIPSELGNLSSLRTLYLYNCGFTSLPPALWNLSSLVDLDLSQNQISGSIPPDVGDLSNLEVLRLDSNGLSGSIPADLGALSSLRYLNLYHNDLTGNIPPELGDLSDLLWLRLDFNNLSGSIPTDLSRLSVLLDLRLTHNSLSGIIPPELEDLPRLQILALGDNSLSGGIPPELGNLTNLTFIGLGDNRLSGGIPPELGSLSNLTSLDLYANDLGGEIPPELGDLENLRDLYLPSAGLGGSIPPELGSLPNLTSLSLEGNELSGTIPPELGDLSSLRELSLDGNQLSGSIPTEITDLTDLQDGWGCDLRWNALHSTDPIVVAFLNQKQRYGDWQSSQTIAPENLSIDWVGDHTAGLSWDPVTYQADPGGYEAFFAPSAGGPWVAAGKTSAKTQLEIPVAGLDADTSYEFAVASYTNPHNNNPNTVTSDLGVQAMATTAITGCASPVIDVAWGNPTTLSVQGMYDSYAWSTGENSATIDVNPAEPRFYWVTVTSPGPCRESAIVLVDSVIFADDFESGDTLAW